MAGLSPEERVDTEQAPGRGMRVDFDSSVGFWLTSLANKLSIAASRRLRARLDVGLMEWRVVALLAVEGQATPARIGQVAGVDKSVVSRAVASLERRGLVLVHPEAQAGRQTRLTLTPDGQSLHDRGIVGVLDAEGELLQGLSPDERGVLLELLKRLAGNVARMEA